MKIEIKNRFTGAVIFWHEQEHNSIKITVEKAVSIGASLVGARLDGASLDGASLDGARLDGASLVGARLDGASLVGARLVGARLDGASLVGARLVGARLDGARLDGARLDGASLDSASLVGATYGKATLKNGIFQFLGKYWPVLIFDAHIKIGCQLHSTDEWDAFTDEEISEMSSNALEFWRENKTLIIGLARQLQK
jgi:uncharacterized protein YjbI with pentapeptide repeats